ncbi:MAG TPA: ATP-binding protein [Verrucomicrobiae bacterium]|nr:ATP-binding protein [Verrucomicrobiae bacterium]
MTNTLQLRRLASQQGIVSCSIRLEGVILWVSSTQNQLAIQDDSGGFILKVDLHSLETPAKPGQRVLIEGTCRAGQGEAGSSIAVVNNDGTHALYEQSGKIYLSAGFHPIRVEWFNNVGKFALKIDCQCPGMKRESIPDAALFLRDNKTGQLTNGLVYQVFEGAWSWLPDFSRLPVSKSGTISNFDIGIRTRDTNVGVVFTGYFEALRDGVYHFWTTSDDGSKLYVGDSPLGVRVLGNTAMPFPEPVIPGQLVQETQEGRWSEMEGMVSVIRGPSISPNLEINSGTGRAYLKVMECGPESLDFLLHHRVKITGIYQSALSVDGQKVPSLLVPNKDDIVILDPQPIQSSLEASNGLPLLTTALQVMNLGRKEALRGYPVRLQGVVTAHVDVNFFIQDSTWSIYVGDLNTFSGGRLPRIGECWQIEGISSADFAPDIKVKHAVYLGPGILPAPIRPTWDELINGSLSTKYMEIQGVVSQIRSNEFVLLTRGGKITILCVDLENDELKGLQDALIHISGVGSSDRDEHQMMRQRLRIYNASVKVDEPAPADPFSAPLKKANDLFFFDARADTLRRVKISGQVMREYHGEFFLMDGTHGFRFRPKAALQLPVGTFVEVVGFPDRNGPSPVLREGVARRTGKADLPIPKRLVEQNMLNPDLDATLVRIKSRLIGSALEGAEQTLELQLGNRSYFARLQRGGGLVTKLEPGCELELTGVYIGQRVDRTVSRDIDSFELLLNSPADIQVLTRPSWWTIRHAVMSMTAMLSVLAAAFVWITSLRRQVEERSLQLTAEIKSRERAERQRALEEERARIAQDLHDDLGSGITEMGMLVALMKSTCTPDEKRNRYLEQVHEKSQEMVTALDEIVWAMNPRHNVLGSLVSYFSLYADRFLGLAKISWRLEKPLGAPDRVVDSRHRYQLFLAFKEALTNIVRHSHASEVRISIHAEEEHLRLTIVDNGSGFSAEMHTDEMNGVINMRRRVEKLGGKFELISEIGSGTTLRFILPLSS